MEALAVAEKVAVTLLAKLVLSVQISWVVAVVVAVVVHQAVCPLPGIGEVLEL
jgi:tetrahydromethanopterin S-methyltransferase subunit E